MPSLLEDLLEIAEGAARAGARVHRNAVAQGRLLEVRSKHSAMDLVTEVDRESERAIVSHLRIARPDDSIIGEEGTSVLGTTTVQWVIDPLDGTSNFVHGYPAHSVAVGAEIDGERAVGVVYDTANARVYRGIAGQRAELDEQPLRVSEECSLTRALTGTGFLPDGEVRVRQAAILQRILPRVRDIRRSGCPSLDICHVARGSLDVFYECGLGRWDISAAAAIAEGAGARVLLRKAKSLPGSWIIVGSESLVAQLSDLLKAELDEAE